jgi:dipeptidyl aminopeptidase/acylaminoacyl peptidase
MKPGNFLLLFLSYCVVTPVSAAGGETGRHFQLSDLRRIVSLGEAQISPDGRHVALVVSRPDWKEDKSEQELDLVDTANGAVRVLTYKRTGLGYPRWSPDGGRLAFIANDGDSKQAQIFVMPMQGGDAKRISEAKKGVIAYSWSPDGERLAFMTEDVPNEKALKHHEDAFKVTDNNYMTRAAVTPWHVWVVAATGGLAKRLTHGDWSVQTDQDTATPLAWSRDGRRVAYAKFPDPYFGNAYLSTIETVSADGGTPEALVTAAGAAALQYSPKDSSFAYLRPRDGDQNNGNAVYVQSGGTAVDVTHALAHNIDAYGWLPDGSGLLVMGQMGTHAALWRQPLQGEAQRLELGEVNPSHDLSVAHDGAIAFAGSTSAHPLELYVMDSPAAKPRRLTHFNDFADGLQFGKATELNWTGTKGLASDGVLTYPVDYAAGQKYPLVLLIHGGPESATVLDFAPLAQLLAAQGFLVFQPNYRGSTNLGDAYQHAIYQDTGEGPGEDVMAGLDAVEKLGIVDTAHIGVSGWSYGGYMSSWLNGRYHVWKVAVEGAALNDWLMDYTISFYQHGDLYFFGGSPWAENTAKLWREQSPITLVSAANAPTLILGDAGDPNVPIVNSYEMYHALQDQGVPVEFYVYPSDSHFPHDIVRETDVYDRWVKWMVKYLK